MAFSGLSTNKLFTATTLGEDISRIIATLAPIEAPFLNWLGDSATFATSTKHEFIEDHIRPTYIIASTAIASNDGSATGIRINGLGEALTVGTLLENTSAAPEYMQVTSVVGANSVLVARSYDGAGVGSLAAGQQLRVRWPAGVEGADHDGSNAQRLGVRRANTVALFHIPISASGTALAVNALGGDSYAMNRAKVFREVPYRLEEAILTQVLNTTSLGSSTATRTMQGVRSQLTGINSQVVVASFATNPALYIRNVWEQIVAAGGTENEEWAIVAGRTAFGDISNLNSTRINVVQSSAGDTTFMQRITVYDGPFGSAPVFFSRAVEPTDTLIVPRTRVKVVPLNGRAFQYQEMGRAGDNVKGLVVGEYTVEAHHPTAMARVRSNG